MNTHTHFFGDGHAKMYRLNWDEEGRFLFADFAKLIGAAHAMELPFIFDSFDTFPVGGPKVFPPKRVSSQRDLSDAMMSYWGCPIGRSSPIPAILAEAGTKTCRRGGRGTAPKGEAWCWICLEVRVFTYGRSHL